MKTPAICVILLFFGHAIGQTELFPVCSENGMWGYIDTSGKQQIAPAYYNARPFSEGLAAVRKNGTYGYINTAGETIIPSVYDYGFEFNDGLAIVYKDAKPYFIDTKGKIQFEHDFTELSPFNKYGLAFAELNDSVWGLINRKGETVLQPDYFQIYPFQGTLAIVKKLTVSKDQYGRDDFDHAYGVVDTNGKFVVPIGEFEEIKSFNEGYAIGTKDDADWIINAKGKCTLITPNYEPGWNYSDFHEGKISVEIYTVDIDTLDHFFSREHHPFAGVIDTTGKLLFSNRKWAQISNFTENRAFALDTSNHFDLINERGEIVKSLSIVSVDSELGKFEDGLAIVEGGKYCNWLIIDSAGNEFKYFPDKTKSYYNDVRRDRDLIYITEGDHLLIWNIRSDEKTKIDLSYIPDLDLSAEVFEGYQKEDRVFITRDGKEIYRTPYRRVSVDNQPLNIDCQYGAYYEAHSPPTTATSGIGGWSGSENVMKPLEESRKKANSEMRIEVDEQNHTFRVVNGCSDTVFMRAQDSHLYMNMQAKNSKGEWKDIEYLPASGCGNSYHLLYLPSNYYWDFSYTQYSGSQKTQLRMVLLVKESLKSKTNIEIYSKPFSGSVNPGQFWMRAGYVPDGIIDPYRE